MCIDLHAKYPSFLSDFNENLNFLDGFSDSTVISNFMKIRPIGDELGAWGGVVVKVLRY